VAADAADRADAEDLPFWDWSSDQSELDDPSDAFAPDRPEYPDGPDSPDYRPIGSRDAPRVTAASSQAVGAAGGSGGSRLDRGLRRPREPVAGAPGAQAGQPRQEGIGQHLGSLGHLSANPMVRVWQWRAVVAIVIVVAFAIWGPWVWGLTLAVLVIIADTIFRAQRARIGPAVVRQTAAQRRTRRQLARLQRAGYRAVHGNVIAGGQDQIDHLVVGPAGVFAIDSEGWDRRLPVRTRNGRQLWHGPFSMKDRLDHARWEADQAAAQLSSAVGHQVTVRAAMAIYGPKIPWDVADIREVDVFSGPRLRRYLRRVARQGDTQRLSESEIERIDKAAQTVFGHPAAR
jgi:hypothetical protein